jgi:prepilin signal peptidase PulO-like enzyme (type II secretory pathway)
VELAVAAQFGLSANRHGTSLGYWEAVVLSVPLLLVLLVDVWSRLIYTNVLIGGAFLGVGFAFGDGWRTGLNAVATGAGTVLILGAIFLLVYFGSRHPSAIPFGPSDVYLAGMIGTITRYPDILPTLFIGALLTGFTLLMLYLTDRAEGHVPVPFGPFLCLSALILLATPGFL